MRKLASLLVFCLLVLPIATIPAEAATKIPSFRLEDVKSGETIDSKIFAGKTLFITFFATWCPPCIQEVPNLIDLQDKYTPDKFSVIGISLDQEKSEVLSFVQKKKINYPVVMSDGAITQNFGGVFGVPTSFLVNDQGTVVKRYTGYVPRTVLAKDIKRVID